MADSNPAPILVMPPVLPICLLGLGATHLGHAGLDAPRLHEIPLPPPLDLDLDIVDLLLAERQVDR